MARLLNELLERLRELVRKAYGAVAGKGGVVPEAGDRTMENLPSAIESVPQTHSSMVELTAMENNKEYLPADYGVDGFSKVTTLFDTSSLPKVKVSSLKITNACINEDGVWEGDILLDTRFLNSFLNIFAHCSALKKLHTSEWDVSNATSFYDTFLSCNSLQSIDASKWKMDNATNVSGMFAHCTSLQSLIGNRDVNDVDNISCLNGLRRTIGLSSTILDRASLRALINGLADLTGQTTQALNLGATLTAKLTDEDIAIAVNKNWTIS